MVRLQSTGSVVVVLGLMLGLAACGGTGTEDPATQGPTTAPDASAPPAATDQPDASAAPDPATPGADVGDLNTATVTIGDEVFEFTDVQCSIFTERYIQAGNFGADPEVSIVLPPEGWESQADTFSPPSVRVKIGDEVSGVYWLAGDDGFPVFQPVPDGSSQIDSYTVPDGRPVTATGTATFIDIVAHNNGQDAPSVTGSFEVNCP